MTKVLILGASGTLGNTMIRVFAENSDYDVWGTVRSGRVPSYFPAGIAAKIKTGIDIDNIDMLARVLLELRPEVVINCVGVVKQLAFANDPLLVLPINSIFPHRLANLCALTEARLVHFSTDCVFSGTKGNYSETDIVDASDLYGQSKFIGELTQPNTITLRTSMIGHEIETSHGLIEWFLKQEGQTKGFVRAVFSGLPTVVLARLVRDIVLPNKNLSGTYHVASEPINKYDLLKIVSKIYNKTIEIIPDDDLVIDRSLNADRFRDATGYVAPPWPEMIRKMYEFK